MRAVVGGDIRTIDAVRHYHDTLASKGIAPTRLLDEDVTVTDQILLPEAT